MDRPFIKRLFIKGLHYYRDFELLFSDSITILVGENGLGKTTVLNILYAIMRGRWAFLSNVGFDAIELNFSNGKSIGFTHTELESYLIVKFVNKDEERVSKDIIEKLELIEQISSGIVQKFSTFNQIIQKSITDPILYLPSIRGLRDSLQVIGRSLETAKSNTEIEPDAFSEFRTIEDEILIPIGMDYLERSVLSAIEPRNIKNFLIVVNQYLQNINLTVIDRKITAINKVSKERISFEQLSSGEKQILYIFSHVYLRHKKNVIILFDEPELSLSLTWQRRILPDIIKSGKCSFLFAITHSPFVFDNDLEKYAQGINMYFRDYGPAQ